MPSRFMFLLYLPEGKHRLWRTSILIWHVGEINDMMYAQFHNKVPRKGAGEAGDCGEEVRSSRDMK